MTKRALLCLALLAGWYRPVAAQIVTARLGGELTGFINDVVAVPVEVDMIAAGGAGLGSYTARMQWDPAVLSLTGGVGGSFPIPQLNEDSAGQGVLRFGAISPLGASGVVNIGALEFRVLTGAGSQLTLSFSEMSAAGTFASLLPVDTARASFCLAKGRWGDLDKDGSSNSRDALAVLSSVVGLAVDPQLFDLTLGDVDADAKVNSRDALIILSYAVGVDIPGQRVLLAAPSSCGTGSAKQVGVFPANASLVVSQNLQLSVRGLDSAGHSVTLSGANWRSSDNAIAGIDANGLVIPRLPGVVTITATVGPGLKAQATITVVDRRPNWYVDIHAIGAPVQLGTQALPFDHPIGAFNLLQEGDTVRVAPGTYLFESRGELNAGAVILGGTPGDTTTRPVFLDGGSFNDGLWLRAGERTLVRNVVFRNFYAAVNLDGVRNFAMEDVRVSGAKSSYGIYGTHGPMDTIRVDRSALVAKDSLGTGVYTCCDRIGLVLIRDSKIMNWEEGARLLEVDSTAVVRSEISANYDYGVEVSRQTAVNPAVWISQSRIERNYYAGLNLNYGRRFVLDSSVVRATDDDGLEIYSGNVPLQVSLHGDSIYQEAKAQDYEWLDGHTFDTLAIDRLVVRYPADTNFYAYSAISARRATITNSQFLNIGGLSALSPYPSSEPLTLNSGRVVVSNVQMAGCLVAGCDRGHGLKLDSLDAVTPLDATIQNSSFTRLDTAVAAASSIGVQIATGLLLDSVGHGIRLSGDSSHVANNVLTRVWSSGIASASTKLTPRVSTVVGNSITCAGGQGPIGDGIVLINNRRYLVAADTVANCSRGAVLSLVGSGTRVVGGALRNNATGVAISQGDTSTVFVDSVGISGSGAGVQVAYGHSVLTRSRVESNTVGVDVQTNGGPTSEAHQNSFHLNGIGVRSLIDAYNANGNWWGADTLPCTGGADCVSGPAIDTTGYLHAEPTPLPTLAPRSLVSASRTRMSSTTGVQGAPTIILHAGPLGRTARVKAPRSVPSGPRPVARSPAEQGRFERQAAADADRAEREQRRAAVRAERHAGSQAP